MFTHQPNNSISHFKNEKIKTININNRNHTHTFPQLPITDTLSNQQQSQLRSNQNKTYLTQSTSRIYHDIYTSKDDP